MGLTGGVKSHRLSGQISPYCEKKRHGLCAYCAPMFHNVLLESSRNIDSQVFSQAYHPLFVWWAVHLQWLYRFIKLAKIKPKFCSFKNDENEIKTHRIVAMLFFFVFLCLIWRLKARESRLRAVSFFS